MMANDVNEVHHFVTEIEEHLRRHNVPAALTKCKELKVYVGLLKGAVEV